MKGCKHWIALLFCLVLLAAALPAPAQAAAGVAVSGVGRAAINLRVRTQPDGEAPGVATLRKGDPVYVLEAAEGDWLRIWTEEAQGWVPARHVYGILPAGGLDISLLLEPEPLPDGAVPFTLEAGAFEENYIATTLSTDPIYETPSLEGRRMMMIPQRKELHISEVSGDWCRVRYRGLEGYMRTSAFYKWERLNPYAGPIPGLSTMPMVVFLGRTADVYSVEDHTPLKDYALPPGSCIAVYEQDLLGRYLTPYHRTTGFVMADAVATEVPVVPWESAQPGDLIAAMTTYYGVGVLTERYQGRNWNIYLSTSMISGTVLQPGQSFDMNATIGPYRRSTGYHEAPIVSSDASSGYGGGTCQVNTTFYVANLQLPILITHRRVHSDDDVGITYVPRGFDAAVGSGNINLKLTNTLPYAIRYQFFVSDGVMTCCIFREA